MKKPVRYRAKRQASRVSERPSSWFPGHQPRCIVIAGPNGAGKTTFAKQFLPNMAHVVNFINADAIAAGLAPFRPEQAALAAGRIFLAEVDRLATAREPFSFETTLSGRAHAARLRKWRAEGYLVEIIYLRLRTVEMSLQRVASRVLQGGHHIPDADVLRRFSRGWENFQMVYKPLADAWSVYDNSEDQPQMIERSP